MRNERRLLDALTPEQAAQLETLLATWLAQFEPAPPAER
jgi:Spy/CpxP family protein refolding chaperone